MRREGRQHGMVRTFDATPTPNRRFINPTDTPFTAGLFTKVSNKPTNHSKYTGKCGRSKCHGCHDHPVTKSRLKSKGTHKRPTTRLEDHYDGIYTVDAELADNNDYDNNDYDSDVSLDSAYDVYPPPQKSSNDLDHINLLIVSNEGSSEIENLLINDGEVSNTLRQDVEFVLAAAVAAADDDDEWYLV